NTGRKYARSYEDPSSALRAASLHRKYLSMEDHIDTVKNAQSRQDTAEGSLRQIVSMVGSTANDETLRAISGTSDVSARQTYAAALRQTQQSLLQFSNITYGDKYLFAGADGKNIAFSQDDHGNITYRGINVSTGEWPGHTNAEGLNELARLSEEKLYVDIGLGMQTNNGGIAISSDDFNGSSAFNISLPGIKSFGFGTTGTGNPGDPKISSNVFALLGEMATELEKGPAFDAELFGKMRENLTACHAGLTDLEANMGVKTNFLEATAERAEDDLLNLNKQIESVEYLEPAKAITDFSYSQYTYNMILKVGNSLLSSSFVDFMR
ncbi:MAG: hypothetical protein RSB57_06315, partial [Hungatella sp.]